MNPAKVIREKVKGLTDLPNIGQEMEKDLNLIGINNPSQLTGKCPYEMYSQLCKATGQEHDPCVIDVFLSITHFMNGDSPKPWWKYTKERKEHSKIKSAEPGG
nr:helix-hairpin-helix domain-containing protein [uncultured Desulfobulbus sp.]